MSPGSSPQVRLLLATVTLKSGKATTASSALSAGSTTITATYNGNGDFLGSAASLVQTVHELLDPLCDGRNRSMFAEGTHPIRN
jgi:hypothetical protein